SKFPLGQAVYFDTEKDGRMIFAIPREGKAYVGTTDTFYDNAKSSPLANQEDRDYLIEAINYMFPDVNVSDEDIESSWAGIRTLILEEGKDPSEISRKDEVWEGKSGLLTIAGGKLTGYRHMALEIVDLLAKRLKSEHGLTFDKVATKHLPISGGDVGGSKNFAKYIDQKVEDAKAYQIDEATARHFVSKYGSNAEELFKIAQTAQYQETGLPLDIYTELIYSIQNEMVYRPTDFFIRRTGKLYFKIDDVLNYKDQVIKVMAELLGYTNVQKELYTNELETAINEAQTGNHQPAVKE